MIIIAPITCFANGSVYTPALGPLPVNVIDTPDSVSVVELKVNEPEIASKSVPRSVEAPAEKTNAFMMSALARDGQERRRTSTRVDTQKNPDV